MIVLNAGQNTSISDCYSLHSNFFKMLWKSKDVEVVVAVIQSVDKSVRYTLLLRDFKTLKSNKWLIMHFITIYLKCFY